MNEAERGYDVEQLRPRRSETINVFGVPLEVSEQQADPDAMMAALDRLWDALFLAKDEAGRTGTVEPVRARELVILCADVYLISNRDEVEARMDRRLGENKATA